jgi:hypothetical protein
MTEQDWMADQIEVSVSGFFTTEHYLETEAGALGEIKMPAFGRESTFRGADGRELVAEQTSLWKQQFELREGGEVLGEAWPKGVFRRDIILLFQGQQYVLQPAGVFTRNWYLADPAGTALLKIEPQGIFRRGAVLTILAAMDVALLIFAYYLVQKRWQAETAAASAAAAS